MPVSCDADAGQPPHDRCVQPLAFAPGSVADGAVALVQLLHHAVGAGDDLIEALGAHLLSIGVNGEGVPPSSFA